MFRQIQIIEKWRTFLAFRFGVGHAKTDETLNREETAMDLVSYHPGTSTRTVARYL